MSIPSIDLTTIQHNAPSQSVERGESYYRAGAVVNLTQRGNLLQAEVEGTEAEPYNVNIQSDAGGIITAKCNCEYSLGGWCKHIVATLLMCINQPETIETRPALTELLARLDLNQTRKVIRELLADYPRLINDLNFLVSSIVLEPVSTTVTESATVSRRVTVNSETFRRKVQKVLEDAVSDWEHGSDESYFVDDLIEIVETARDFTQAGDVENAIAVLTGITQGCVDDWDDVDNYGAESDEIVAALDKAWTEAILTAEVTTEWQTQLRSQFAEWQSWTEFEMSQAALQQGWNYPPLLRVFQGEITELGAWEEQPSPYFADDLALVRLEILERQARYQDYIYLAEAEGHTEQYLTMLVRLGRIDDAMTAAKTQMGTVQEAFVLAKTLQADGFSEQGLEIAQAGLALEGHHLFELATWTGDLAAELGKPEIALSARVIAFKAKPSVQDYQKIETSAGADWNVLREDLLNTLRQESNWSCSDVKVAVFLQEGLIDDAISTVSHINFYSTHLIHQVMDAAMSYRPDWVIENARLRAEDIMNRGKADAYQAAVDWLQKAKVGYLQSDKRAEWVDYFDRLKQTHGRKYKLMGLFGKL